MKTGTKVIIGIVAAVAVIGAGAGVAASLAPQTEGTFLTEEIQVRDVDVTVAASGTVDPSQEFGLQFPGAATATLETLLVSVGDTVTEGQVLASINTLALKASVATATASVASANSAIANAETSGDSARQAIAAADQAITAAELSIENIVDEYPASSYPMENDHIALLQAQKQKVTAEASLETARRQLEAYYPLKASAEASLSSARAALVSARLSLENAQMTAPVAGTVVAIASQIGEPVGSTTAGTNGTTGFIVLAALDTFVVKADFAESEVVGITTGQSVTLEFDAIPGEIRDGSVTEVALFGTVDVSGASLTTYEVTISVPDAPVGIRAGMTAQASITTEEQKGVVAAPVTALIEQGDGYIVQVEGADGTISSIDVQVGIRGGYYVEIISGLSAGDRVVTGSNGVLPDTGAGGFGGPPEGVEEENG